MDRSCTRAQLHALVAIGGIASSYAFRVPRFDFVHRECCSRVERALSLARIVPLVESSVCCSDPVFSGVKPHVLRTGGENHARRFRARTYQIRVGRSQSPCPSVTIRWRYELPKRDTSPKSCNAAASPFFDACQTRVLKCPTWPRTESRYVCRRRSRHACAAARDRRGKPSPSWCGRHWSSISAKKATPPMISPKRRGLLAWSKRRPRA